MNYPAGAYQELQRIEQQQVTYAKALTLAADHYAVELRTSAKEGKPIKWTNLRGNKITSTAESFVTDFMPEQLMTLAVKAWMAGNQAEMVKHLESAFQVGFDLGVEFLAAIDVERDEL